MGFFPLLARGIIGGMDMPLLTTKFYISPFRPESLSRPCLIERLAEKVFCLLT